MPLSLTQELAAANKELRALRRENEQLRDNIRDLERCLAPYARLERELLPVRPRRARQAVAP